MPDPGPGQTGFYDRSWGWLDVREEGLTRSPLTSVPDPIPPRRCGRTGNGRPEPLLVESRIEYFREGLEPRDV